MCNVAQYCLCLYYMTTKVCRAACHVHMYVYKCEMKIPAHSKPPIVYVDGVIVRMYIPQYI